MSRRTGVSVAALRRRNGIWTNLLRIRQRIIIPTVRSRVAKRRPTRYSGDINLLAKVIHAEAGAESYTGKVAVGGVILNRVQNPRFPQTIAGVVYQPHAFESVSNGIVNRPASRESMKAARDALNGWDPSGGAIYFFNPAKTRNRWIWGRRIINRLGKHVFAI
ncbi:MAG: spore cortex-lytic enzyme [Firmicutes bacterium]|nr:spore cortex-lytic enzyme [Bacillota bacterium]